MNKHVIFFVLFAMVAAVIGWVNTHHVDLRYAYLSGSLLFVIPTTWFCITRPDLIRLMLLCGAVGIPFGVFMEYFFYTKDWWLPQTITGTRIGIEDVVYSFFHGVLLSTTGLVLLKRKIYLSDSWRNMAVQVTKLGSVLLVVGFLGIVVLHAPSFIVTTLLFSTVGIVIVVSRPDLLKVGLLGMVGTISWSAPVFWITNSFFPNWIQHFWINNTDKILIMHIPLPDLCWYASVGFSAAILPEALVGNTES
jgi:hypothetical protein